MKATLHAGTVYFVELPDGTQSEPRVLQVDTEVKTLALDEWWHLYERADGEVLFVRAEDDL